MYTYSRLWMIVTVAIMLVCSITPCVMADRPDPDDLLGVTIVHSNSCVAIWVPMASEQALSGVVWYNNDSTVEYPQLLATAGSGDGPGSITNAVEVAGNVQGGSLQWSEWWFEQPVASEIDGLYLLFRLPAGSVYVEEGTGGGAAIGYWETEDGPPVWLTLDGEEWIPLHENYTLACEFEFTEALAGTPRLATHSAKSLSAGSIDDGIRLQTELLPPSPNPFNPKVSLRFALERAEEIELCVYDLKGREVRKLAQGLYSAGPHVVEWMGRDQYGHATASGLYIARLKTESQVYRQRMMLLR